MATIDWANTGDWFSSLWLNTSGQASGPPVSGDTGFVFFGTLTITAADAQAHPTIDGIALGFASVSSDVVPTLDVTNVAFGAGMAIDNETNGHSALLIARGTVALAGTLQGDTDGGVFSLDLAAGATFTDTGTLAADNAGSLAVAGAAGALLTLGSAGQLLASDGTASIGAGVSSTGTIGATTFGEMDFAGSLLNLGTLFAAQQIGAEVFEPGTIVIGGSFTNQGHVTVIPFGTLDATGGVANAGTVTLDGGAMTLAGGVANAGLLNDQSGTLFLSGGVTGGGLIQDSQEVDIAGPVAAAQMVSFGSNDAMLRLSDAAGFAGTIESLGAHDAVDLQGVVATSTSLNTATHLLTVLNGNTAVATLDVSGLATTLNAFSDGTGGTLLALEPAGTPAQVTAFMIANSADVASDAQPAPHHWPTPNPVITYTFDAASSWSATEQAAFQNAMALYSAFADVSFQQVTSGPADIDFVRDNQGVAVTNSSFTGTIDTAVTIEIDTSVPSWESLDALGTADTSGFGGYGFQTVLHEMGHALGLGHPGPYNETANITQQIFYTDTHQYSVMSYFGAAESGADWLLGTTTLNAQTPMLYDISAVQQIYGANTSELTGGDTFGFNSTFGTASVHPLRQYDFTQDTTPVVTLYDGGPNNTLDLSGFAAPSTVDLAAGSFSSADGMTDNIAIALGTTIDSAVGGGGNDIFVVNGGNDTIDGGGGSNTVDFSGDFSQYTLDRSNGTITVGGLGATDLLTNVATLDFADRSIAASGIACFLRGTRVRTPGGEVPVETLRPGDSVLTASGRVAPVRWVGARAVNIARHPRPWDVRPIRIRAHAIAPDVPARDLLLSPDHAVALDGALVPARHLVNGATVTAENIAHATYLHVELDRHDIILAENLACESFLDTGNRAAFHNSGPVIHLHPDFSRRVWDAEACLPLLVSGDALCLLRGRLLRRAERRGFARSDDARPRLRADRRALRTHRDGDWLFADVPPGTVALRLLSRAWVPLHMLPDPRGDSRRLGVCLHALRLDGVDMPLDAPHFADGWHAPEADGRWSDGAGVILPAAARRIALRWSAGLYWRKQGIAA